MISAEQIMVEQLSQYLASPPFHATRWSEALLGRGLEYFLYILQCSSVPRKRRTLPAWAPWPWDVGTPGIQGELYVSDEIYEILCEVVRKPASYDVLICKSYGRECEDRVGERTELNEMWRVVI
jgi:hypothetical protein